jgi:hypothetical protein
MSTGDPGGSQSSRIILGSQHHWLFRDLVPVANTATSMVTACIVLLYISYAIPIVCLLVRGRNNIRHGPFWLGPIGLFSNIVLLLWTVFTLVMYSFPPVMPVEAGSKYHPLLDGENCSVLTAIFRHELCIGRLRCRRLHHRGGLVRARQTSLQRTDLAARGGEPRSSRRGGCYSVVYSHACAGFAWLDLAWLGCKCTVAEVLRCGTAQASIS